jgi:uncharacterized protein
MQLLQAGADPNSSFREGVTPLMRTRSPDVANCLLDHGADIARETGGGSTALEEACASGRLAVVKVLLKRGALGQMLKQSKFHTPLSLAANNKHEDVTLLLLEHLVLQPGFEVNHSQLATNQPLLCCAAARGLCRVAEFALDHGADPNITGPNGPPLILAVKAGHYSMVSLLCERGADVQTQYSSMHSLDEAVLRGNAKVVTALIKHGADVNAVTDSECASAVIQAAVFGHCDIVQLLLDTGAAPDAEQQLAVLSECCYNLDDDDAAVDVVKLLLPHFSRADSNDKIADKMLVEAVLSGKLQLA